MTVIGLLLIPMGLVGLLMPARTLLLVLTVYFTPFTATAVINLPGFGVQPAYFFGALFLARLAAEYAAGAVAAPTTPAQVRVVGWFTAFGLIALLSVLLIPFYAPILVSRPSGQLEWLRFSSENVTQLVYLVFVLVITCAVALLQLDAREVRKLLLTFVAAGIFVSAWGWFQVACHYVGVEYPTFLFNNNESFLQHPGQVIREVGLKRMNSVAPEPSMLARFLLIPTFITWYAVFTQSIFRRTSSALAVAVFLTITMISTTSTTALAGLAGGVLVLAAVTRVLPHSAAVRGQAGRFVLALAVACIAVPGLLLLVFRYHLGFSMDELWLVLRILLVEKVSSQSGVNRATDALYGLQLLLHYPLMGVGWGSNRTFDFASNILSTTGLLGFGALLAAMLTVVTQQGAQFRRLAQRGETSLQWLTGAVLVALLVRIWGKLLSEPGIVFLDFWIIVAIAISMLGWSRGAEPEEVR